MRTFWVIAYTKWHDSRHGKGFYIFEDTIRRTRTEAWIAWRKNWMDPKAERRLLRTYGGKAIKIRIVLVVQRGLSLPEALKGRVI